jgi:hypothetical protein
MRIIARHGRWSIVALPLLGLLTLLPDTHDVNGQEPSSGSGVVEFDRQIRPILSENCFTCHGPDAKERKARLRLDTRDGALASLRSGGHAIVPGKSADSALIERVRSEEPGERMPPPRTKKRLTRQQIDLLRRWIDQGANWSQHWSFVPPRRRSLPPVKDKDWPRNGIDRFILARLEKEGLRPSPKADRVTLIRRLTLDLTGLPPTPAEVDAFVSDQAPNAYDKVVDRLLASPHYGERMAVDWLDAARFADTHGYHIDSGRDMTRWREWVIDAFNTNLPYDRFTVEQLAGDLLPNAGLPQKIASGFNRNHMINFEGGAIPAEYHNAYLVDRVNTTATVWLGLTVACAQCHDHKYDPISQKDYYRLYAFFNNLPENGLDGAKGNAVPVLKMPTKEQRESLDLVQMEIQQYRRRLTAAAAVGSPLVFLEGRSRTAGLEKQRAGIERQVPSAMVMQEMASPRDTFLLVRGQYDKPGEKVTAEVPASLPSMPKDAPKNRLGLARWLVSPEQPLMARVTVNRFWQVFFGTGLVKTAEDFGIQGELPSHPELLDWLAVEFMQKWDVKALVRSIVTSATYRQSSVVTPSLHSRDPENRLLARGPRFRLQAEFIRDQALAISGLLNRKIGGASVFPYQPAGLWQELASRGDSKNWSAQFFVQSKGKDLYRRSMYTFWKRTSPPPQMITFDAPDREVCTVRRSRTNTPLQALVLLNDPTYIEASRKLAERMMKEGGAANAERIDFAFRLATARHPKSAEIAVLERIYMTQRAAFAKDEASAQKLLRVGESPRDECLPLPDLAAWTMVASVILNLDETVTKG